jgi:hypothetical protein
MKILPGTVPLPEGEEQSKSSTDDEEWIRCGACSARLAPARSRLEVNGAHEHAFMNPAGLHFVVACFAVAPGCDSMGEASSVWTWFPGHAWKIALCRGCGEHVGWSFHAADGAPFYGLVRDRVVGSGV